MFKVILNRVRVDLGFETFVDCNEGVGVELLSEKTDLELIAELKDFIKERNGQVVEVLSDEIVIDTTDLTLNIVIETDRVLINDKFDNWTDYFFAELSAE